MPSDQLDKVRAQMQNIRSSFRRELQDLRRSPNYTDQGRKQEIARTWLSHRKQADALRSTLNMSNEDRRKELQDRLFGMPAGADGITEMSMRDARQRVAGISARAAAELKASSGDDTLLMRALAQVAFKKNATADWSDLLDDYARERGLTKQFQELADMPSAGEEASAVTALFSLGLPPTEIQSIAGSSEAVIQQFIDPDSVAPAPRSNALGSSGSTAPQDLDRMTPKQRAAAALRTARHDPKPESVDGSPTAPSNPL